MSECQRSMRKKVATVAELWRYPVKSMRGERLSEMVLTERGAVGDRLYAMRELKYGSIMSARIWAAMLQLRAVCERAPADGAPARVRIEFPDGAEFTPTIPASTTPSRRCSAIRCAWNVRAATRRSRWRRLTR